jgi:hypothetical protein
MKLLHAPACLVAYPPTSFVIVNNTAAEAALAKETSYSEERHHFFMLVWQKYLISLRNSLFLVFSSSCNNKVVQDMNPKPGIGPGYCIH